MKAASLVAPQRFEIVEMAPPSLTMGKVLLRMQIATICGSDIHIVDRELQANRYPSIPGYTGHECVGTVEKSDTSALTAGDRVLVLPPASNGFAEYLVADPDNCVPIPNGMEWDRAVLGQQLGTVIWGCKKLSSVLDKNVAIIGQGPAGLNFTAMMRNLGARSITTIETLPHRRALSRRMGATLSLDPRESDPVSAIQELTGHAGVDVVVEAVGHEETINQAYQIVREFGTVLLFGIPVADVFPGFRFMDAFRKQAVTLTTRQSQLEPGRDSFRLALDFINRGRVDVSPLISHRVPLDALERAFHLARTGQDGAVKVLIEI